MSESKQNENHRTSAHHQGTSDAPRAGFSMPFQPWMALWREEAERMTSMYDAMTEQSVREMRRNLDECHRWMGAQLDVSRQMHAAVADAARRLHDVWHKA